MAQPAPLFQALISQITASLAAIGINVMPPVPPAPVSVAHAERVLTLTAPRQVPVDQNLEFPRGFLWGVAVAGHQVEGGDTTSSWAHWESEGRTAEPIGMATDSWDRYESDIALAAQTGATAYRLSIEWSRVEPKRGVFDEAALDRYAHVIDTCRYYGIEPIVTLYHFSYPEWLDQDQTSLALAAPLEERGWERDDSVSEYARYVQVVANRLKGKVHYWITLNEPNVEPVLGYLVGIWPPGKVSPLAYSRAIDHMEHAHVAAYDALHAADPTCEVSTNVFRMVRRTGQKTTNFLPMLDPGETMLDALYQWRDGPGSQPRRTLDYVAFDYYYAFTLPQFMEIADDWTWPIYPRGLYDAAKYYYTRYHLPVLVAENGMATHRDQQRQDGWTRPAFLVNHLYQLQRATQEGVPVLGYCYWSLMDNYEWGSYAPTFGLYEVDRSDPLLERIPTEAADVYRRIASANRLPDDLVERYLGRKS